VAKRLRSGSWSSLWAEDSEPLELRFELRDAVNLESYNPNVTSRMNVDPCVVEKCDPSRWHVQIANDLFVDFPIRFHLTELVGKVVVVHQRLDTLTVERCVEHVRVAEASDSSILLEHTEK